MDDQQMPNQDYEIDYKRLIGVGSYGQVYICVYLPTKEIRAVKIIDKTAILSDIYMTQAFASEVDILKRIHHDNIIKFYDFIESAHKYYLITEYCAEGSLSQLLKKRKQLTEKEAKRILKELCSGFMVLVREGITHRDLKPANILLTNMKPKIIDFGLSTQHPNLNILHRTAVGTPLYMSLQVLQGEPYTSKCDIWSIGVIFYQMLHGKTPWHAKSEYKLVKSIEEDPLVIDPSLSLSHESISFLESCLQKEEGGRMNWPQLFAHPIFQNSFSSFPTTTLMYHHKLNLIMSQIRFLINSKNIQLPILLSSLGLSFGRQMTYKQFKTLIHMINPSIKERQVMYIFTYIDRDRNESVSGEEILVAFNQFMKGNKKQQLQHETLVDLAKISEYRRLQSMKSIKSMSEQGEEVEVEPSPPSQKQIEEKKKAIKKLQQIFVQVYRQLCLKGKTLFQLFEKYDVFKTGHLTFEQFSTEILKYEKSLTEEQLHTLFQVIDTDLSNTIEFDEFNAYFCQVNKIPPQLMLPDDWYHSKIQQLKRRTGDGDGQVIQALRKKIRQQIQKGSMQQ